MIRLLLCDDQEIARVGLQLILSTAADVELVGIVCDGQEAVEQVARLQPDLVLMDLKMPRLNGVQATRRIRQQFPQVRVLVLTTYDDDEWVLEAVRNGANGYLLKDTPPAQLLAAIRGTASGQTHVDPNIAGKVFTQLARPGEVSDPSLLARLSEREKNILRLLAQGALTAEIAKTVGLSEGSLRNALTLLFEKLGVADRTQAVVVALRNGLT